VSTSDFLVQFWPLVQSLIPSASRYAYQCEEVFLLAHTLLKRLAETTIESLKLGELVNSWGIILIQHKCIEVSLSQKLQSHLMTYGVLDNRTS
jgi:ubiquitin carboxyl-terminal hydrolase 34